MCNNDKLKFTIIDKYLSKKIELVILAELGDIIL